MSGSADHVSTGPAAASALATIEEGIVLPEGFQARLMQRIMTGDLATDILDFSWQGLATTLLQLLEAIFGVLLGPQPATAWQPA